MSRYEEIYSELGLKKLIELHKEKIKEKQKEYKEVCEGKRYNPLCADGWKVEIKKEINGLEEEIVELEDALKIKQNLKGTKI